MKTITVLSGKGGVGKSSVAASLAVLLSQNKKIICADSDVDASNLALIFGLQNKDYYEWKDLSTAQIAEFDREKCTACGRCLEACHFDAIVLEQGKPRLKEFGCEGCGACGLLCPSGAIKLVDVKNAKIGWSETEYGFRIISSQLNMGYSGSGRVVAEVKKRAQKMAEDSEIMLVDSAAGIGCPVIASVSGSDYCLLLVEPTPSGIHDMKKALALVRHFSIPTGLIINKSDINSEHEKAIEDFAQKNNIKVIAKIPFDRDFARALVAMKPVIEISPKQKQNFEEITEKLLEEIK